jgi:hypothetical protein
VVLFKRRVAECQRIAPAKTVPPTISTTTPPIAPAAMIVQK